MPPDEPGLARDLGWFGLRPLADDGLGVGDDGARVALWSSFGTRVALTARVIGDVAELEVVDCTDGDRHPGSTDGDRHPSSTYVGADQIAALRAVIAGVDVDPVDPIQVYVRDGLEVIIERCQDGVDSFLITEDLVDRRLIAALEAFIDLAATHVDPTCASQLASLRRGLPRDTLGKFAAEEAARKRKR